jgi:hypothetical protein
MGKYIIVFSIVIMLLFGTGTMVSSKMMLETSALDNKGESSLFTKPFYQTILMFFAMSACLPVGYIQLKIKKTCNKKERKAKKGGNRVAAVCLSKYQLLI